MRELPERGGTSLPPARPSVILPVMDATPDPDPDLTRLMARFGEGDHAAAEQLLARIHGELRAIAEHYFRHRAAGHTLQPTALVNEAYVKLVQASKVRVHDRKHFFAIAARVMRQILVDHARSKKAMKRGGDRQQVTVDQIGEVPAPNLDVLALEEALEKLALISPDRVKLVELRFFGGLTSEEAAEALGISRAEAARRWRAVRAWLTAELRKGEADA